MVLLESVPPLASGDVLRGLYRSSMETFDDRESTGRIARDCAGRLGTRLGCSGGAFASAFPLLLYDEGGNLLLASSIRLDPAVNVFDVSGTQCGWISILNVPASAHAVQNQLYAFAFNSASPAGNPAVNWGAIFEASIVP